MKRWGFNVLAAASLLFCLATDMVWVRSCWRVDDVGWITPSQAIALVSSRGQIAFYRDSVTQPKLNVSPRPQGWFMHHSNSPFHLSGSFGVPASSWGGFATNAGQSGPYRIWMLVVPAWAPTMLLAVLPAYWVFRHRKRRLLAYRAEENFCSNCGYDLRASPDRCPECGTVPLRPKRCH